VLLRWAMWPMGLLFFSCLKDHANSKHSFCWKIIRSEDFLWKEEKSHPWSLIAVWTIKVWAVSLKQIGYK
jgi:hypothetical protein